MLRIGCSYVTKHTKHKRGYGFDNDCEPGTSLGGTTGELPSHSARAMAQPAAADCGALSLFLCVAEAAVTCFIIPAKGAPVDVTAQAIDAAGLVAA